MKKIYNAPAAKVLNISTGPLLNPTSVIVDKSSAADPNYSGGGDVREDLSDNIWELD